VLRYEDSDLTINELFGRKDKRTAVKPLAEFAQERRGRK